MAPLYAQTRARSASLAQINGAPKRSPTYLKQSSKALIESDNPLTVTALVEYAHGRHQPTSGLKRLLREWTKASEQDQAAFLEWVSDHVPRAPA
jgi:hypothetical protein